MGAGWVARSSARVVLVALSIAAGSTSTRAQAGSMSLAGGSVGTTSGRGGSGGAVSGGYPLGGLGRFGGGLGGFGAGLARGGLGYGYGSGYGYGYGFGLYYNNPADPMSFLYRQSLQNGARATMGPIQHQAYPAGSNSYMAHLRDDPARPVARRRVDGPPRADPRPRARPDAAGDGPEVVRPSPQSARPEGSERLARVLARFDRLGPRAAARRVEPTGSDSTMISRPVPSPNPSRPGRG